MSRNMKTLIVMSILAIGTVSPQAFAKQSQPGTGGMSGMPGMSNDQTPPTDGKDMQTTMRQCAQMKDDMAEGKHMSGDMQKMMTQCDRMDRMMRNAPAPAATQDR